MNTKIKTFDVQFKELTTSFQKAFEYISNPENLPKWTMAFSQADQESALMVTPRGELSVKLKTEADYETGVVDWHMTLPDGSEGTAYSRLTRLPDGHVVYSFVLLAPPVPLELLEGALAEQSGILAGELETLGRILG